MGEYDTRFKWDNSLTGFYISLWSLVGYWHQKGWGNNWRRVSQVAEYLCAMLGISGGFITDIRYGICSVVLTTVSVSVRQPLLQD